MAKRTTTKKRFAAALFKTLQQENELPAEREFRAVATQTVQEDLLPATDSMESKLNKCLTLLAHANAKLDALGSTYSQCKQEIVPVSLSKIDIEPVRDAHGMNILEEKCKNVEFVRSVVASIGQLHGRQRYTGKGVTVCLQIVDYFFDRQFLLQCSWTGIGRHFADQKQAQQKIQFCKFEKVIDLFYQTVRHSDPEFSLAECKAFLHRCLRNAKQRFSEIGGTRKPSARKRKHLQESNHQETDPLQQESNANEDSGQIWTVEYAVVE